MTNCVPPNTDFTFLCLRFLSCQWGLWFCFPHIVDGECITLQGCCNTASQSRGFKNKRNNRNPKSRCWQGCTAPETCREDPSLLLLVAANSPWHSSAPRYGPSASASVNTQLPHVYLSYEDTSGLEPTLITLPGLRSMTQNLAYRSQTTAWQRDVNVDFVTSP